MKRRAQNDNENGFAEHGGYMAAKISKLEEQFSTLQNIIKKSNLFEGKYWKIFILFLEINYYLKI